MSNWDPTQNREEPDTSRFQAEPFQSPKLISDFEPTTCEKPIEVKYLPAFAAEQPPAGIRWWIPAIAVVGLASVPGAYYLMNRPATAIPPPEPYRPLGLFVDTAQTEWRVTWNMGATALSGAKNTTLFVRDTGEQKALDLRSDDRTAAVYRYVPTSNDVIFRLEVTEASGRMTAESYRVVKVPAPAVPVKATPVRVKAAPVRAKVARARPKLVAVKKKPVKKAKKRAVTRLATRPSRRAR